MKLATYGWRVLVKKEGKWFDDSYYGYQTKKLAEKRVNEWTQYGYEAKTVKEN